MKDIIHYTGFRILIINVCVLFFSNSKPKDKTYIYNSNGNKVDLKQISFSPERNIPIDSIVKIGSLDGEQSLLSPVLIGKPFNPDAPFSKLTFRMLRKYIPGRPIPEEIKNLNDINVEILEFMTPLNALKKMDEFLLCSAPPLSCYCAPPIFINEIIYVKLINKKTNFNTGAIKIKGQFHVNTDIKDEYSDIIYSINATDID